MGISSSYDLIGIHPISVEMHTRSCFNSRKMNGTALPLLSDKKKVEWNFEDRVNKKPIKIIHFILSTFLSKQDGRGHSQWRVFSCKMQAIDC